MTNWGVRVVLGLAVLGVAARAIVGGGGRRAAVLDLLGPRPYGYENACGRGRLTISCPDP